MLRYEKNNNNNNNNTPKVYKSIFHFNGSEDREIWVILVPL